ncbi:MAG: molybdopterin molybdotransferase MoeA [Burkholderiales bacterium]|nr:molybdopterin molybdotransferase MoeA [Burkholderiales bacterium]
MSELGPSPLMAGDLNLSVAQARATIAAALTPITGSESVGLTQALGRVLAADVISPIAVPAHDNSAMDGYAFAGARLVEGVTSRFTPIGTAFAGAAFAGEVGAGQCVRIMTGAVMPAGCDTVVPQELCGVDAGSGAVCIEPGVIRRGENRRKRGEDLALGGCALPAGRVIRPVDLGLIASLGITSVTVRRRLRVALFSTGNELRSPDQPLDDGCIYDSNRYSLMGALQRLGMEVVDLGLVRDDPAALQATLDIAVAQADVVLTSGGVSVGEADYTRTLLASMGEVAFWKVAMRPGRPFAFGPLRGTTPDTTSWLFALPGNPVAALVTFYVFARDALLQLAGATPEPLVVLQARSTAAIRKRPGRSEFQRGRVSQAADGAWQVEITGSQGAGILRSMSEANCLVVLGHEQASVAVGDRVDVWLFDGLV